MRCVFVRVCVEVCVEVSFDLIFKGEKLWNAIKQRQYYCVENLICSETAMSNNCSLQRLKKIDKFNTKSKNYLKP